MSKVIKTVTVFSIVLLIACTCVWAAPPSKPAPAKGGRKILIEAYIAEVSLEALYKLGVSPIGVKDNLVTIQKIQKCLKDKKTGLVTTGIKVAVSNNEGGQTSEEKTIHVERSFATKTKSGEEKITTKLEAYKVSIQFGSNAAVLPDGKIKLQYNCSQKALEAVFTKTDAPPTIVERKWSSSVTLSPGKPTIVGASQGKDTAVFLIINASIEN